MQQLKQAEALRWVESLRTQQAQPEPLTDSYVQPVPDKCDRITWRNRYYHLPLEQAQPERAPLSEQQVRAIALDVKNKHLAYYDQAFARAIEAAHGIKQGGQHD